MAASPVAASSLWRRLAVTPSALPRRPNSGEVLRNVWRTRQFASRAEAAKQEAALRKAQQQQEAAKQGAVPVGLFMAVGGGLGFGAWFSGFFDSGEAGSWSGDFAKGENMVAWLKTRGIKVVAFELNGCMRPAEKFCRDGCVMRHEVGDYINGASHDFIEAANVLARHDFDLAVATYSDTALCTLPGRSPKTHVAGAELAKLLLTKRCPEAVSHFSESAIIAYDARLHGRKPSETSKRDHMNQIAQLYGVTSRQVALFDVQKGCPDEDGYLSILVEDPKEGFKFEDFLKTVNASPGGAYPKFVADAVSAISGFVNSR